MPTEPVKPLYNSGQADLYSVLETLWDNYENNMTPFTDFSASYVLGVATTGRALVTAAKNLPDDQARGEAAETARIELVVLGKGARTRFKALRSYIRKAFDKSVWKPKIEAAGLGYFSDDNPENWENVKQMFISMKNFIAGNSATLLGGDNMPATFEADTINAEGKFNNKYTEFKNASETGPATAEKIRANNAAYGFTMDGMVYDAAVIFEDAAETAALFIFDRVLTALNPGTSGAKGDVEESVTNIALGGTVISFKAEGKEAIVVVCDEDGNFNEEIPADTYVWTASVDGHVTKTGTIVIEAGSQRILNIELDKIV